MYKEIAPSLHLTNKVEAFWTVSNNESNEQFKVLPDACVDLIIDLNQPKAFVSGVMNKHQFRSLRADVSLIAIRFKAEYFKQLFAVPGAELKNLRTEITTLSPHYNGDVLNRLIDLPDESDQITLLESWVTELLSKNEKQVDQLIIQLCKIIREVGGVINVQQLATQQQISTRQLERRFKNDVGLTIKEFASIVRFNNAKSNIAKSPNQSLLELAFDHGFFDHAHMGHEFKRLSGENPGYFR